MFLKIDFNELFIYLIYRKTPIWRRCLVGYTPTDILLHYYYRVLNLLQLIRHKEAINLIKISARSSTTTKNMLSLINF